MLMKRHCRPLPFVEITNSVGSLMLKNAKHRLVGENKNNACLCTVSVLPLEPIVLESMPPDPPSTVCSSGFMVCSTNTAWKSYNRLMSVSSVYVKTWLHQPEMIHPDSRNAEISPLMWTGDTISSSHKTCSILITSLHVLKLKT